MDNFNQERAFFVTEYIDGAIDGEVWLEKYGPMDLKTGLAVGLQIAKGLEVAHQAGIFHLDLKPANILLKQSKTGIAVKIIDFGLSQVASSLRDEATAQQSRSGLTTFGRAVFGTLDYAPPEQQGFVEYGEPNVRSDVFAFGALMYRLLTCLSPRRFSERKLPNVQALRELLFDCVEENPTDRPESARDLVRAIEEIKNGGEEILAKKREAEEQRKRIEAERRAEKERIEQEKLAKKREAEDKRIKAEHRAEEERKEAKKREQAKSYRYTDNGDGTVTDNKTGLIWLKKADSSVKTGMLWWSDSTQEVNWETAMQWAAKLAHGQCGLSDGSKAGDWRLPNKEEWEAMIDKRYKNPSLSNAAGMGKWKEGDAFTGVQSSWYWSSSTDTVLPTVAWYIYLSDGDVGSGPKTSSSSLYVWPVRGGQ